jgi:hypothetical protein
MPQTLKVEVTEKAYQTFLDISVHLTGFGKNELLATGMHETYYYTIMKEPDQDNVRAFFKEAQKIMDTHGDNEVELNKQIAEHLIPTIKYVELAKRIILVWYTGIWTTITLHAEPVMISSESYAEGLIWKVAETHPAGAKQPGFGSWEEPPIKRSPNHIY